MAANLRQITQKALPRRKFDAIVIGGGHNGLIAVSLSKSDFPFAIKFNYLMFLQLKNGPVLFVLLE